MPILAQVGRELPCQENMPDLQVDGKQMSLQSLAAYLLAQVVINCGEWLTSRRPQLR